MSLDSDSNTATPIASTATGTISAMAPQAFDRFLSSLKDYYDTDTLSDAIIACEDQAFKVHGVILSAHSKYFAKALGGDWKESSEKKIEIKDFDPSVVEAMLRFMYSFTYSNTYGVSSMVFDAQVYQIADKYDISALKELAKDRFGTAIATGWSMDDFPLAVGVVYSSTPSSDRGLRDLAIETARKNIDKLLDRPGFNKLLRETADFGAELIPFLCGNVGSNIGRYKCPTCNHEFFGEYFNKAYFCPACGRQNSNWNSCLCAN